MLAARSSPATVNQALAAVTLMYEQAGLRISVKRVRIPRPCEPDALTRPREAVLRRVTARRGPRDAAIIAVLFDTGARVEKCARLDAGDFAITARTGEVCLHGKGDEVRSVPLSGPARELVSAWLDVQGRHPAPPGPGSAARSPAPASPRSCLPPEMTPRSPDFGPITANLSPRDSAWAALTLPRRRPCLVTPRSTPPPERSGSAENAAVIERVFGS